MAASTTPALEHRAGDAYRVLAPHYDAYTDHPAYAGWVAGLEALARAHGLAGRRALDVGCGTGKSFAPLAALGYAVTGCEPCAEMLDRARRRAPAAARLVHAGLPDLPDLGGFDYVTCLNDVLNYLEPGELPQALRTLAGQLRPGGVVLFDTNTLATYRGVFAGDHVRVHGDTVFAWRGATAPDLPPGGLAAAWLDVFVAESDGRHRRHGAEQLQRHHPEAAVEDALSAAGLELTALRGQDAEGLPTDPLDATRHAKAIWVARKPCP